MHPDYRTAICCSMLEVSSTAILTKGRSRQLLCAVNEGSCRVLTVKIPAAAVPACSLSLLLPIYRCHTRTRTALAAGLKDNCCALSLSCCCSFVQLAADCEPCWRGARLLLTAVLEGDDDGCDIVARVAGLHHLPSMVRLRYELHHAERCQCIEPATCHLMRISGWQTYLGQG